MQNVFGRNEVEFMLPFVRRPESGENLVAARLKAAAEIDKVSLAAAVMPSR